MELYKGYDGRLALVIQAPRWWLMPTCHIKNTVTT